MKSQQINCKHPISSGVLIYDYTENGDIYMLLQNEKKNNKYRGFCDFGGRYKPQDDDKFYPQALKTAVRELMEETKLEDGGSLFDEQKTLEFLYKQGLQFSLYVKGYSKDKALPFTYKLFFIKKSVDSVPLDKMVKVNPENGNPLFSVWFKYDEASETKLKPMDNKFETQTGKTTLKIKDLLFGRLIGAHNAPGGGSVIQAIANIIRRLEQHE